MCNKNYAPSKTKTTNNLRRKEYKVRRSDIVEKDKKIFCEIQSDI